MPKKLWESEEMDLIIGYFLIGILFEIWDNHTSIDPRPSGCWFWNLTIWPVAVLALICGWIDDVRGCK